MTRVRPDEPQRSPQTDIPDHPVSSRSGRSAPARANREGRRTARVPASCLVAYTLAWTALAIAPRYRADWLLENIPVFLIVPLLVATYPRFHFSDRAYVQGAVFLLLHAVGSHYTYSEVPAGDRLGQLLGFERNHYDRIVHFLAGVLLLRPVRELAFRGREPGPLATPLLCIAAVVAGGAAYEIVEWLVAAVVDPAAGTAFLGTQGDPWDAQTDMALAGLGALVAALVERVVDPPGHGRRSAT